MTLIEILQGTIALICLAGIAGIPLAIIFD